MIDENKIREGIKKAIELGWTIGYTGNSAFFFNKQTRCCCPLGACYIAAGKDDNEFGPGQLERCEVFPDVHIGEISSFADGFDGRRIDIPEHLQSSAYLLGKKFREEYGSV